VQGYLQQENRLGKEGHFRSILRGLAGNISRLWGHLTAGIF
jgi:hypothetical protein